MNFFREIMEDEDSNFFHRYVVLVFIILLFLAVFVVTPAIIEHQRIVSIPVGVVIDGKAEIVEVSR